MPIKNPDAVIEILSITSQHDACDEVWWRCDGEYAPVTFLVNCNDFFYPAADAEEVTEEDLPLFRQSFEDCAALDADDRWKEDDRFCISYAGLLFAARKRDLRPWERKLDKCPERIKPLFKNREWGKS